MNSHAQKACVMLILCASMAASQSGLDTLDRTLDSLRQSYQTMGVSVCIVKNNSIVFTKGYGLADYGRQMPVTDSTLYRIASISKTITATALMQLYEQGRFRLDDDVSRFLGFTLRNPFFPGDTITVQKILSHTASLRDGDGYASFLSATASNTPPPSIQLMLLPGGSYYTANMWSSSRSPASNYFTYANVNFGIVATLVEQISGERFDIYCRNHILQPLGMIASFNIQDIPNINNIAVLYRKPGGVWTPQADDYRGIRPPPRNLTGYLIGTNGFIFSPQGGLRTSAGDLAKFMLAHMNGGQSNGVRILNDTTAARMHQTVWTFNGTNGENYYGIFNRYALGISTTLELLPGQVLVGHPGEAYGLISDMYFGHSNSYGIIFITNGGARDPWDPGRYSGWYRIEEDVYQAALRYAIQSPTEVRLTSTPFIFELHQNHPNPFNPSTNISFSIARSGHVKLKVYDILGREVASLIDGLLNAGQHDVRWRGDVAAGVYVYRLTDDGSVSAKKMLLVK